MDLGTSHESASNMPRSLWPAVPLWGIVFRGGGGGRASRWRGGGEGRRRKMAREEKRRKERVRRSACVRSAVRHYARARKAGLKRANKKVVKASTGGGGCTDRGISYRRRRGSTGGEACCHALPVSPLSSDALLRFSSTSSLPPPSSIQILYTRSNIHLCLWLFYLNPLSSIENFLPLFAPLFSIHFSSFFTFFDYSSSIENVDLPFSFCPR